MKIDKRERVTLNTVVALVVTVVAVIAYLAGRSSVERPDLREVKIGGAAEAWSVWTECGVGSAECDAALKEVNEDGDGVQYFEDGSAYKQEDGRKFLR